MTLSWNVPGAVIVATRVNLEGLIFNMRAKIRAGYIRILRRLGVPAPVKKIAPKKPVEQKLNKAQQKKLNDAKSMDLFRDAHKLYNSGEFQESLEKLDHSIALMADNVRAWAVKADILAELGQTEQAVNACLKVLAIDPLHILANNILSSVGSPIGFQPDAAKKYAADFARSASRHLAAARYSNLFSKFELAIRHATAGMDSLEVVGKEDFADVYQRLALERVYALEMQGRLDQALNVLDMVEGLGNPDKTIAAKARCHMELGDFEKAASLFGLESENSHPDRVIKEAIPILYGLGKIGEAHQRYRVRESSRVIAELAGASSILKTPLTEQSGGSLFLFSESGPGDEIRFSTLYGQLENRFDSVRITCEPRLHSLLARSYPNVSFLPLQRIRKELRRFPSNRQGIAEKGLRQFTDQATLDLSLSSDCVGTVLDALGDLRLSRDDFASPSLLKADPGRVDAIGRSLGDGGINIGISWRSILKSSARDRHYFEPRDLAPFSSLENCRFVLLQAGAEKEEIDCIRDCLKAEVIVTEIDLMDDFDGQAALINNLDLVISPFTSMGELAGALGTKTILLSNSHQTTWRCGPDERDIWYPHTFVVGRTSVGDRERTVSVAVEKSRSLLSEIR